METWTQPAWTPSPLPWPAPFSAWTSAPRPAKNKFRNYIPCLCLGYQMREAFPSYRIIIGIKRMYSKGWKIISGVNQQGDSYWIILLPLHYNHISPDFHPFPWSLDIIMSHRFVQSIIEKRSNLTKPIFPTWVLQSYLIRFSATSSKHQMMLKQNHLSHSLSLYSIKFQQEIFNDCEASHFHPIYYAGWFFLCNFVIGIWDNCFLKFFLPPLVLASFLYILRSAPRVYWEDKINCLYV